MDCQKIDPCWHVCWNSLKVSGLRGMRTIAVTADTCHNCIATAADIIPKQCKISKDRQNIMSLMVPWPHDGAV